MIASIKEKDEPKTYNDKDDNCDYLSSTECNTGERLIIRKRICTKGKKRYSSSNKTCKCDYDKTTLSDRKNNKETVVENKHRSQLDCFGTNSYSTSEAANKKSKQY